MSAQEGTAGLQDLLKSAPGHTPLEKSGPRWPCDSMSGYAVLLVG